MLVDSVALLGLSTIQLNTLRKALMKRKLPDHLFNDIKKRIN